LKLKSGKLIGCHFTLVFISSLFVFVSSPDFSFGGISRDQNLRCSLLGMMMVCHMWRQDILLYFLNNS